MIVCPNCSTENADGARFCSACGAALEARAAHPREERKVVTVLFADLVGFTARAEQLDPEDVRRLLAPYHAHLRQELERFAAVPSRSSSATRLWRSSARRTRYVREGEGLLAASA